GDRGFASDPGIRDLREDGVQYSVGNMVAELVRRDLDHRLRREQVAPAAALSHRGGPQLHLGVAHGSTPVLGKTKKTSSITDRSQSDPSLSSPRSGSCRNWHRSRRGPVAGLHRASPSATLDKSGNAVLCTFSLMIAVPMLPSACAAVNKTDFPRASFARV